MRYLTILLIFIPFSLGFAGDILISAPKHISEYDDFSISIGTLHSFSVELSDSCLRIWGVEGVSGKDGVYSTDGGKIRFENKCFGGEKLEIRFRTSDKTETIKYKVLPRITEEQDYGC